MAKKRRRRSSGRRNPGVGATTTIAIAASVVAVGLTALVMQNRKNLALNLCSNLSLGTT